MSLSVFLKWPLMINFQCCTSILNELLSKTLLWLQEPYKNLHSDTIVASGSKRNMNLMCHMPSVTWEISCKKVFFHFQNFDPATASAFLKWSLMSIFQCVTLVLSELFSKVLVLPLHLYKNHHSDITVVSGSNRHMWNHYKQVISYVISVLKLLLLFCQLCYLRN